MKNTETPKTTETTKIFKSFSELKIAIPPTITIPNPTTAKPTTKATAKTTAPKKTFTPAEPKYKRTVFGKGVACYFLVREAKQIATAKGTGIDTLHEIAQHVPQGDRVLFSKTERPLWDRVWKRKIQHQRIQKRLNYATGKTEMITKLA